MINKILGYIILAIGLIIILGVIWQSYNIFNGKILAPEIFKDPINITKKSQGSSVNSFDIQAQTQKIMQEAIQEQISSILPSGSLTKILNLIVWSIFAGIIIFAGSVISGIGIKLLKN